MKSKEELKDALRTRNGVLALSNQDFLLAVDAMVEELRCGSEAARALAATLGRLVFAGIEVDGVQVGAAWRIVMQRDDALKECTRLKEQLAKYQEKEASTDGN
jgi:hypothetical protein